MALNKWFVGLLILFCLAEVAAAQAQIRKYVVYFTDKQGGNPFSISQPQQFLTQRSIQRRINQNLPVDSTDLPVTPAYIQGVQNLGATIYYQLRWLNGVIIECSAAQQSAILGLPYVIDSRPLTSKQKGPIVKKATKNGIQSIDYGPSFEQNTMIGIDSMHSWGFHGEGMVIAVLDAGFLNVDGHAAFSHIFQNNRLLGVKDFFDRDGEVYGDNWHGGAVLSNIGGYLPGKIVGGAFNSSYYLLRTENEPSENEIECALWVAGLEYADSVGVDIVNTSLGYSTFDNASLNYNYSTLDGQTAIASRAAGMASSKGIVVVCSAGNEGNNTGWGKWITSPADADNILTVGSVNSLQVPSSFSGKGPTADGRKKPDVVAQGGNAIIANVNTTSDITTNSGTSFSAPIVCGLVAGFWQAHPQLTAIQVINYIKYSGSNANSPDNVVGWGVPNFVKAHILAGARPTLAYPFALNIFPNPNTGNQLTIEFLESNAVGIAKLRLVNTKGQTLVNQTLDFDLSHQSMTMDLGDLSTGVYFVHLEMGGKKFVRKVVLN